MRNLQVKVKKHSVSKIVLTFHCSNKLLWWSQFFFRFSAFSLEFPKIFSITRTFFLTVGQNNFENKILKLNFQEQDQFCKDNCVKAHCQNCHAYIFTSFYTCLCHCMLMKPRASYNEVKPFFKLHLNFPYFAHSISLSKEHSIKWDFTIFWAPLCISFFLLISKSCF